jgi:hypothetical protein
MMMGTERSMVGVSGGPRASSLMSEIVGSSRCWSGTISYDSVASKHPCWSSFRLGDGGGGSIVTGGMPRSLHGRGAHDPPLFKNIKYTLGISIRSKTTHTRKKTLQDKTRKH